MLYVGKYKMGRLKNLLKRGDTLIEVTFAISVFSLVSVLSIQVMDRDVAMIQGTLEAEMARNEIDAQAEAIRYIQNSYLSEREFANKGNDSRTFQNLWLKLSRDSSTPGQGGSGLANRPTEISSYSSVDCNVYYNTPKVGTNGVRNATHQIFDDKAFAINTRKINPADVDGTIVKADRSVFREAPVYPRIVYTGGSATGTLKDTDSAISEVFSSGFGDANAYMQSSSTKVYDKVASVEGIWVISAKQEKTPGSTERPEFYDFHIRTCWFSPGRDRPSTIATTIRLYNPEYVEDQQK